jgi:hypothetical protein
MRSVSDEHGVEEAVNKKQEERQIRKDRPERMGRRGEMVLRPKWRKARASAWCLDLQLPALQFMAIRTNPQSVRIKNATNRAKSAIASERAKPKMA